MVSSLLVLVSVFLFFSSLPNTLGQTPIYGYTCCCGYSTSIWATVPARQNPCTTNLFNSLYSGSSITCKTTEAGGHLVYVTSANNTLNITSNTPGTCSSQYNITCSNGVVFNGEWQRNFDTAIRFKDLDGHLSATEEFACLMVNAVKEFSAHY